MPPELEAKTLPEHLLVKRPADVGGQALRSFYRRVAGWKRAYGPPKEGFSRKCGSPERACSSIGRMPKSLG